MYEYYSTIEEMIEKIVDIANFLEDNFLGGEYGGYMTVGDEEYEVEVYGNGWCSINGINFDISFLDVEYDADIEKIKEVLGIKEEAEV